MDMYVLVIQVLGHFVCRQSLNVQSITMHCPLNKSWKNVKTKLFAHSFKYLIFSKVIPTLMFMVAAVDKMMNVYLTEGLEQSCWKPVKRILLTSTACLRQSWWHGLREDPFNLLDPTFGHCPNSYWTPPPHSTGHSEALLFGPYFTIWMLVCFQKR